MTPEILRATFPLTARHHFVACAKVALHWAFFPTLLALELAALTGEQNVQHLSAARRA